MITSIERPITASLDINDRALRELYSLLKSFETDPRYLPLRFEVKHVGGETTTVERENELSNIPNTIIRRVTGISARVGAVSVRLDAERYLKRKQVEVSGEPMQVTTRVKELQDWAERHETTYTWASHNLEKAMLVVFVIVALATEAIAAAIYHLNLKQMFGMGAILGVFTLPYMYLIDKSQEALFPDLIFTFNGGERFSAKGASRRAVLGLQLLIALAILALSLILPRFLFHR